MGDIIEQIHNLLNERIHRRTNNQSGGASSFNDYDENDEEIADESERNFADTMCELIETLTKLFETKFVKLFNTSGCAKLAWQLYECISRRRHADHADSRRRDT